MPISCTEKEKHRHDRRLWKVIFRVFWGSTIIVPVAGKNSNWFQLRCNSIFTSVRQALQIFPQGRTACVLYISRYLHCIGGKVLWAQNCHTATKFSHHLFLSCQWMLQYIFSKNLRATRYAIQIFKDRTLLDVNAYVMFDVPLSSTPGKSYVF